MNVHSSFDNFKETKIAMKLGLNILEKMKELKLITAGEAYELLAESLNFEEKEK